MVAGLVMLSCFGSCNGSMLTGPRVLYAMAREGLFFRSCARLHPWTGTPARALVYQGLWSMVLAFRYQESSLGSQVLARALCRR